MLKKKALGLLGHWGNFRCSAKQKPSIIKIKGRTFLRLDFTIGSPCKARMRAYGWKKRLGDTTLAPTGFKRLQSL